MPGITGLVGETIQGKNGEVDITSWCQPGKVIALYFSAHWCPPCRKFTPDLAEFYNKFKNSGKADKLEIIFVSSDRDEGSFNDYYETMPWHALPYPQRDTKGKLSGKFKVKGIPTLVLLEADTGKIITSNGREKVASDKEGAEFPWYPMPLSGILSGSVLKSGGGDEVELSTAIKGKVLGIYFSAHWCPPCRGFTPTLVKTYNALKAAGKNFEVLFVSSDKDDKEFQGYWGSMPWLAIPRGDKRKDLLSEHFEVEGIPHLQILDENLKVISNDGRSAVAGDPEGKEFPWIPKPLNPLTEQTAGGINSSASLVYLTGDDKDKQKTSQKLLQPIAEAYVNEYNTQVDSDIPELAFYYENEEGEEMVNSLRGFLKLGDQEPLLFIVDIPKQQKYVHSGQITKNSVQDLVQKFKAGKIDFAGLR